MNGFDHETEAMVQIAGGLLLESGSAEVRCSFCRAQLRDTKEPDYKECPECGDKYWVVVGYSGNWEKRRENNG